MKIGSLCSGVGLLELGLEWAGLGEAVWQVEIDSGCRAVLAQHWPKAKRFEDVTTVQPEELERVGLVCAGFPCSDVSSAGPRVGLSGSRSGLWYQCRRIIEGVAPPFVVVENVASGKAKWLCEVRENLHALGYRTRALGIAARDVGAPHRRERIFVVGWKDGPGARSALGNADGFGFEASDLRGGGGAQEQAGLVAESSRGARAERDASAEALADGDSERSFTWGGEAWTERAGRTESRGSGGDGRERDPSTEALADGDAFRRQRFPTQYGTYRRVGLGGGRDAARCGEARSAGLLPDADGDVVRLDEQWLAARRSNAVCDEGNAQPGLDGEAAVERRSESGLGRDSPRNASGMDGVDADRTRSAWPGPSGDRPGFFVRWPAARHRPQFDWEPPRAIPTPAQGSNRRARLRALGNCVVPTCGYVAGLVLRQIILDGDCNV